MTLKLIIDSDIPMTFYSDVFIKKYVMFENYIVSRAIKRFIHTNYLVPQTTFSIFVLYYLQ